MVLVQPILNFKVPFLPTQLSFSLLMAVSNIEADQDNSVEIRIYDPTETLILEEGWNLDKEENHDGKIIPSVMVVSDLKNMPFTHEGTYRIDLIVNDYEIGHQTFDVYKIGE